MANLKDIVAALAILSAGTLTLTGCKKTEGETTTPDAGGEVTPAEGETPAEVEAPAEGGEAPAEGEASCSGEGSCSGHKA